ncbi:MAG: TetR/AcrR family transcriptional regulator [Bacteroidia bacterium]|nr:TetR/AcrR family transcriptional regulator [Bacteroidia bacterium]
MNPELENILSRIYNLYFKYGIKSVTMDDVSRELGISKKTLYEHFKDKDEMVSQVFELERNKVLKDLCEILGCAQNAILELFLINKYFSEKIKNYNANVDFDLRKYHFSIYENHKNKALEAMHSHILANLNRGIKEKVYRNDFNAEFIARLHVSRLVTMQQSEIFTMEELLDKSCHRELIVYHVRGIATQEGIKILEKELENIKKESEK